MATIRTPFSSKKVVTSGPGASTGPAAPAAGSSEAARRPALGATPERVAVRAYEIFEERRASGAPGDAVSDWLRAEREVGGAEAGLGSIELKPGLGRDQSWGHNAPAR